MRFGIGEKSDHTLEEVGQNFDVTRERIRQIQKKATNKIKKHLIINNPDLALDYVNMNTDDYYKVLNKLDNRVIKRKSL
jgi:DNA-directed RNA polymerase sigma subunit (sigma70/sigma32)